MPQEEWTLELFPVFGDIRSGMTLLSEYIAYENTKHITENTKHITENTKHIMKN